MTCNSIVDVSLPLGSPHLCPAAACLGKRPAQGRKGPGYPRPPLRHGRRRSGCRLSKTTSDGLLFKFLSAKLQLAKRAKTLDEGYVLALAEQVEKSGLDKAVILAQDAVYTTDRGKPDWDKTQFYIPNDYLFQVVARYPADGPLRLDQPRACRCRR